ncbi:MAG: hypothetical protein LBT53_07025 [Puniceicoccales bacterium]|nr:hypothetical protein [Puniceicoccales bacterium]
MQLNWGWGATVALGTLASRWLAAAVAYGDASGGGRRGCCEPLRTMLARRRRYQLGKPAGVVMTPLATFLNIFTMG